MNAKMRLLCLAVIVSLVSVTSVAPAQENLPQPDPTFQGKIGKTHHDSEADPALFNSPTAPKGAPNILLIMIDDAGFEAPNTIDSVTIELK